MNQKIEEAILFLKQCYLQRDPKNIDELMNLIYEKDHPNILIGTSLGEICANEADWRDLFLSDWEYWGNLRIDENKKIVTEFGDQTLVSLHAQIEFVFTEDENQYLRYLETMKNIQKDESKTNYQKACKMEWMLCHLLSSRDEKKRTHVLDIRIDLIFQNDKVRLMAFYFPQSIDKAEAYVGEDDFIDEGYHTEIQNMVANPFPFLNDLIRDSFAQKGYPEATVHAAEFNHLFYGVGIIPLNHDLSSRLEKAFSDNIDSTLSTKDKLYHLRRDIAYTFKQYSVGEHPQNYVRFYGVFHLEDSVLVIDHLQPMFPWTWILEDK